MASGKGDIFWKHYQFPEGATYRGSFKGTRKEGRGYWFNKNERGGTDTYEGEYHDNKQHGWGCYRFDAKGDSSEKSYHGQWEAGEMHGKGTYIFSADESFTGEYKDDKKHGKGVYTYENGVQKEQLWEKGELKEEQDCGPVLAVEYFCKRLEHFAECESVQRNKLLPDDKEADKDVQQQFILKLESKKHQFGSGATYEGSFLGSKKHGAGVWIHPEGDEYDGQYRYNSFSGWGVYAIGKSKKKYWGGWRDGKMNGAGVYFFNASETEYYIGSYTNDQKHGVGLYRFHSGAYKHQQWNHGKLVSEKDVSDDATLKLFESAKKMILENVAQHTIKWKPNPDLLEGPPPAAAEE